MSLNRSQKQSLKWQVSQQHKKSYTFCRPYIKKMSNPTIKEREGKFNILSKDLNIKLIKGT